MLKIHAKKLEEGCKLNLPQVIREKSKTKRKVLPEAWSYTQNNNGDFQFLLHLLLFSSGFCYSMPSRISYKIKNYSSTIIKSV